MTVRAKNHKENRYAGKSFLDNAMFLLGIECKSGSDDSRVLAR